MKSLWILGLFISLMMVADAKVPEYHQCIHDTVEMERLIYHDGMDHIAPQDYDHARARKRGLQTLALGFMRINISTLDLYNDTKYCTSASGTAPDFKGSNTDCTADEDIFNSTKRDILLNNILPEALGRLESRLRVDRVAGNLVVPGSGCSYYTTPTAHTTTGIENADYVLYISAGKTTGSTLAWAGYCKRDQNGRPIVGRANFGPKWIKWGAAKDNEDQVDTATHEILHALGFSNYFITNYFKDQPGATTQSTTVRGGSPALIINTTKAVAQYKSFLGCNNLIGPELENEGGSGTRYSHWERRNLKEEIMCGAGGSKVSNMTLSVLEDSGYYYPEYSQAESMKWGADLGCGLIENKCDTEAGGLHTLFCNDPTGSKNCTYDYAAIGYCGTGTYGSDLPSYYQYFSGEPKRGGSSILMDYCPIVREYSNRLCNDSTSNTNDAYYGHYYGDQGRCMEVESLIQEGRTGNAGNYRCLHLRCPDGIRVQLKVHTSDWQDCPTDGSVGKITAPAGYEGNITCPKASSICDSNLYYHYTCSNSADCNNHASSVSGTVPGCTCTCSTGFSGTACDSCAAGYEGYPSCALTSAPTTLAPCSVSTHCNNHASSVSGTVPGCTCTCSTGFSGTACDSCAAGYEGYPSCALTSAPTTLAPCSVSTHCNNHASSVSGTVPSCTCTCSTGFSGMACDSCALGYVGYPSCALTRAPTTNAATTYEAITSIATTSAATSAPTTSAAASNGVTASVVATTVAPATSSSTVAQTALLNSTNETVNATSANATSSTIVSNVSTATLPGANTTTSSTLVANSTAPGISTVSASNAATSTEPTVAPLTAKPKLLSSSNVEVVTGRIVLRGSNFAALLRSQQATDNLMVALQSDLAKLLNLNRANIWIKSLAVGSLLVDYSIINVENTGTIAASTQQILQSKEGSGDWLTDTQAVYNATSSEPIVMESGTATEVDEDEGSMCGKTLSSTGCSVVLISLIIVFVAVILCSLFFYLRSQQKPAEPNEESPEKKVVVNVTSNPIKAFDQQTREAPPTHEPVNTAAIQYSPQPTTNVSSTYYRGENVKTAPAFYAEQEYYHRSAVQPLDYDRSVEQQSYHMPVEEEQGYEPYEEDRRYDEAQGEPFGYDEAQGEPFGYDEAQGEPFGYDEAQGEPFGYDGEAVENEWDNFSDVIVGTAQPVQEPSSWYNDQRQDSDHWGSDASTDDSHRYPQQIFEKPTASYDEGHYNEGYREWGDDSDSENDEVVIGRSTRQSNALPPKKRHQEDWGDESNSSEEY